MSIPKSAIWSSCCQVVFLVPARPSFVGSRRKSFCLDASASSYSMPEYLQPKVAVWTSRGWILVRLDGCGTTDRRSLSAPHETMMGHLAGELSPGGNKH
jgi:hypothetical protein